MRSDPFIIKKYESTGISVEQFKDELNDISIKLEETENEYRMEFNYYKKMRRSGASVDDKRTILNRIIKKYRTLGINVKECMHELEKLGGK